MANSTFRFWRPSGSRFTRLQRQYSSKTKDRRWSASYSECEGMGLKNYGPVKLKGRPGLCLFISSVPAPLLRRLCQLPVQKQPRSALFSGPVPSTVWVGCWRSRLSKIPEGSKIVHYVHLGSLCPSVRSSLKKAITPEPSINAGSASFFQKNAKIDCGCREF